MSALRYFNNVTTKGGNNLELLSTFRDRVIMIILNLLQLGSLKRISEVYESLSHQKYKHNSKYCCLDENYFEMEKNFLLVLDYCSFLFGS